MFNRGTGRPARTSSSDDGGVLLTQNRASELEHRVPGYDAALDERVRTRAYQLYLEAIRALGGEPNESLRGLHARGHRRR
jgi:hypothetical protein